ncbi:MAG: SOS response-associated peptidase family protein [Pseudomonadota bacterium]
MCNLYSMTANRDAIIQLFRVGHNRAASFDPVSAIFPGHSAPVVTLADDGDRELVEMSWGFVLPQKDKAAKRVTNARDDKVQGSAFWRSSLEERRCLVPVTSFSEPKGRSPAVWHWFGLNEARAPFAFAGIWRSFKGRLKADSDPVELQTYAFLTTTPNSIVRPVHPSRMPVMLSSAEEMDVWLEGSPSEAFALARPYADEGMAIVQAGSAKEDLLGGSDRSSEPEPFGRLL